MKAIVKYVFLILLIASCSTVRKVTKESYLAQSNATITNKEQQSKTIAQKDTSIETTFAIVCDTTIATITTIEYSPPDSIGKQHIEKQTIEKVKKWTKSENSKQSVAANNTTIKEQQSKVDSTNSNKTISQQSMQLIKKTSIPISIYIIAISIVVILIGGWIAKQYIKF